MTSVPCRTLAAIFFIVAILTSSSAMADSRLLDNPDNHYYFGLRMTLDLQHPGKASSPIAGNLDMYSDGAGIEVGTYYHLPVKANLYFEPSLAFYLNTFQVKKKYVTLLNTALSGRYDIRNIFYQRDGVRLPLMMGYHFDVSEKFRFNVFTGPVLELALFGKESIYIEDEKKPYETSVFAGKSIFRRFDVLWRVGAGFSYRSFDWALTYSPGFLNVLNQPEYSLREQFLSLQVSYHY